MTTHHYRSFLRGLCVPLLLAQATCGPEAEIAPSVPLGIGPLDPAVLARERRDDTWRRWAERDRLQRSHTPLSVLPTPATRNRSRYDRRHPTAGPQPDRSVPDSVLVPHVSESFEDITPARVNYRPLLPIPAGEGGPSALHVQILLDRARFSPGILDGKWGQNTDKAIYWFQHAYGLPPTGQMDSRTYDRLVSLTPEAPLVKTFRVTPEVLEGPFVDIPSDIYARSELDCLCYESPAELVAERFHATREVLAQLNPHLDLDSLQQGMTLWAPNLVAAIPARTLPVARIVISKQGSYTQALDAAGTILFHFPSTLGSGYDPSPEGDFHVTAISFDPYFHYQPELFHEVPDHKPTAMLPKGPNSPVGVVWMALSKAHYGIHGTSSPGSIGYTSSHGCVRLTNWDARRLARQVRERTSVEFR